MNEPPPDSAAVLDRDLACARCDYNLRTLTANAVCPECGEPIARTLESQSALAWARRIRAGFWQLLIWASVALAVSVFWFVLVEPRIIQWSWVIWIAINAPVVLVELCLALALLWLSHPLPTRRPLPILVRQIVVFCAFAGFAAAVLQFALTYAWFALGGTPANFTDFLMEVLNYGNHACKFVLFSALAWCVLWLCHRVLRTPNWRRMALAFVIITAIMLIGHGTYVSVLFFDAWIRERLDLIGIYMTTWPSTDTIETLGYAHFITYSAVEATALLLAYAFLRFVPAAELARRAAAQTPTNPTAEPRA